MIAERYLGSVGGVLTFLLIAVLSYSQQPTYDFIIRGARVVDGTGAPWFIGDVAIAGDRIQQSAI